MQNIKTILNQIETEKQIKILYACETGSRVWGFPWPHRVLKSSVLFWRLIIQFLESPDKRVL